MFGCRWSQSTPPSVRQFKLVAQFSTMCGTVLFRNCRLVRALRCFLHSQTHFESKRSFFTVHSRCYRRCEFYSGVLISSVKTSSVNALPIARSRHGVSSWSWGFAFSAYQHR